MNSDKSEDISNNSLERDNDTFMEERQPTPHQKVAAAANDDSSATPVYGDGQMNSSSHEKQQTSPVRQPLAPLQGPLGQHPQQHVSFFSKEYKPHRLQIHKRFVLINTLMATLILTALSIYWGSYYNINDNLKELKMLVVIGDENTIDGIPPAFGNAMEEVLQRPQSKASGDWHIFKESEFKQLAEDHDNTIRGEIIRRVHHQLYWAAIYVKPNASYNYHQALVNGDTKYNASDNTVAVYYETGRDFLAMRLYVTPQLQKIQSMWFSEQPKILTQLSENVTIESTAQKQVFSQPIHFTMVDRIPFTNNVLSAPLQVGFIYMIIVSFFQFNFFAEPHQKVAKTPVKESIMLPTVIFHRFSHFFSFH